MSSPTAESPIPIPYRIETPRLVIRCWSPADVHLLMAAMNDATIQHLRSSMPWAHREPLSFEARLAQLRRFRGLFDLEQDSIFGIFDRDETRVLGGTGLHPRIGDGAREIGYWLDASAGGKGYMSESTAALTRVGFEVMKLDRIEIHCAPSNLRSAAVPRRLGYMHEATLRRRTRDVEGQPRDTMIWTMLASDYPQSPCANVPLTARDVLGNVLLS